MVGERSRPKRTIATSRSDDNPREFRRRGNQEQDTKKTTEYETMSPDNPLFLRAHLEGIHFRLTISFRNGSVGLLAVIP
jgi:hypothetical protein